MKGRILVAEDDKVQQFYFLKSLSSFGFEVIVAASGSEAVEAAGDGKYDMILMDINLPGLSGFDAARMIRDRQCSGTNRVPIIAISGRYGRRECLSAGMDDYYEKPILKPQLAKILHDWCPASS